MKKLQNLGKILNKEEQRSMNGGRSISLLSCPTVCLTAQVGHRCVRPHCLYICDGNGGYNIA